MREQHANGLRVCSGGSFETKFSSPENRYPVTRPSVGAIFFLIGAVGLAYGFWFFSKDLPDHAQLANYEPPVMTRVHAADGSLIAEYARERRLYVPIQSIPNLVKEAFLSALGYDADTANDAA